jgi:hypothetical protein
VLPDELRAIVEVDQLVEQVMLSSGLAKFGDGVVIVAGHPLVACVVP